MTGHTREEIGGRTVRSETSSCKRGCICFGFERGGEVDLCLTVYACLEAQDSFSR